VSKIQTQQFSNITSWTTLLLTPQPETGQYHTQRAQNHLLEGGGKTIHLTAFALRLCLLSETLQNATQCQQQEGTPDVKVLN
jgi:hypothetical protein